MLDRTFACARRDVPQRLQAVNSWVCKSSGQVAPRSCCALAAACGTWVCGKIGRLTKNRRCSLGFPEAKVKRAASKDTPRFRQGCASRSLRRTGSLLSKFYRNAGLLSIVSPKQQRCWVPSWNGRGWFCGGSRVGIVGFIFPGLGNSSGNGIALVLVGGFVANHPLTTKPPIGRKLMKLYIARPWLLHGGKHDTASHEANCHRLLTGSPFPYLPTPGACLLR